MISEWTNDNKDPGSQILLRLIIKDVSSLIIDYIINWIWRFIPVYFHIVFSLCNEINSLINKKYFTYLKTVFSFIQFVECMKNFLDITTDPPTNMQVPNFNFVFLIYFK